jgi:putative ABC transport system permease protein
MLRNYIKIAWKVLGRNKFFTFVSLFGISFTLAVLIVVISLLDNMLQPSYPEPERDRTLYVNRVRMQNAEKTSSSISSAGFYFLKEYVKKLKTPEKIGIISNGRTTNTFVRNKKLRLTLKYTDDVIWQIYDHDFVEGKAYNASNIANNDYVAVITEETRDDYFGKNKQAVGQTIITDNTAYRVIGVVKNIPNMPPDPVADIFVPYNSSKLDLTQRQFLGGYTALLLAPSKGEMEEVKREFQSMVSKIEVPADYDYSLLQAWAFSQKELVSQIASRNADDNAVVIFFSLLIGGMLLFMLLPTLNLVNINVSRIMERASEIGVRKAFGATSGTLAIQFIVENIILTLIGGLIGLGLAFLILQLIQNMNVLAYTQFTINFKVFLIAILLCVLLGFLWGVLPAIRMSSLKIVNAIKGEII